VSWWDGRLPVKLFAEFSDLLQNGGCWLNNAGILGRYGNIMLGVAIYIYVYIYAILNPIPCLPYISYCLKYVRKHIIN
jgi:hypothetical protein